MFEYRKNYWKTSGSLWNYYRDETSNPLSSNSKSFKYKTSITGNTNLGAGDAGYDGDEVGKNEAEIFVPIKHLSNFWRTLNISWIKSNNFGNFWLYFLYHWLIVKQNWI